MSGSKERPVTSDDKAFAERAGELFRASVDELDAGTRSRLNRGRQTALSALADAGSARARWSPWVPAAGVAAVALMAVVMWNGADRFDGNAGSPPAPFADVTDMEILLDQDEFEMLEDLEFYVWLGSEDGADVG